MTLVMTWEELCADPSLNDLPYKIETDRFGRLVMSPTSASHGEDQGEIAHLLRTLLPGWTVIVECGIDTPEGTRVPDVAAFPRERCPHSRQLFSLPFAPDICVEVHSLSNTQELMDEKRRLYADRGGHEFWVCSQDGVLSFFDAQTGSPLPRSLLCPDFPNQLPRG